MYRDGLGRIFLGVFCLTSGLNFRVSESPILYSRIQDSIIKLAPTLSVTCRRQLKRNLSYAIRINCGADSVETLKNAVKSVLEHHFGNHSMCGDWCIFRGLEGEELEEAKVKYRCKEKNNKFYLQVKALFEEFYGGLEEMMHQWDTNIVEGLNKFFTNFLPKDRTLVMTIENKV
jgi:hypothetical protein